MKPKCIRSIWDNENQSYDRYTVITTTKERSGCFESLGLSDNPTHPLGFSQFCVAQEGEHLGKRLKWEDLSLELRTHIINRLTEGE